MIRPLRLASPLLHCPTPPRLSRPLPPPRAAGRRGSGYYHLRANGRYHRRRRCCSGLSVPAAAAPMDLSGQPLSLRRDLYPHIEPYDSGFLNVSGIHTIYYEQSGNPHGHVFGGSWGSTLALAYSQNHPDKVTGIVLRGIFLLKKALLQHMEAIRCMRMRLFANVD